VDLEFVFKYLWFKVLQNLLPTFKSVKDFLHVNYLKMADGHTRFDDVLFFGHNRKRDDTVDFVKKFCTYAPIAVIGMIFHFKYMTFWQKKFVLLC